MASWYHGLMTIGNAEKILMTTSRQVGDFLVLLNNKKKGMFVICRINSHRNFKCFTLPSDFIMINGYSFERLRGSFDHLITRNNVLFHDGSYLCRQMLYIICNRN